MPEDLKVSQIGSSPLPPPFRGLHSPGVRKHCQIIFACYFRKSSIHTHCCRSAWRPYQRDQSQSGISSLFPETTFPELSVPGNSSRSFLFLNLHVCGTLCVPGALCYPSYSFTEFYVPRAIGSRSSMFPEL